MDPPRIVVGRETALRFDGEPVLVVAGRLVAEVVTELTVGTSGDMHMLCLTV